MHRGIRRTRKSKTDLGHSRVKSSRFPLFNCIKRKRHMRMFVLMISILMIPTVIFGIFAASLVKREMDKNFQASCNNENEQLAVSINVEMSSVAAISYLIASDPMIKKSLTDYARGELYTEEADTIIQTRLSSYYNSFNRTKSLMPNIYITLMDGRIFGKDGSHGIPSVVLTDALINMKQTNKQEWWVPGTKLPGNISTTNKDHIYYFRSVYDEFTQHIGYVVMRLSISSFMNYLLPYATNDYQSVYLLTEEDEELAHVDNLSISDSFYQVISSTPPLLNINTTKRVEVDKTSYYVSTHQIQISRWSVITVSSSQRQAQAVNNVLTFYIVVDMLSLVVSSTVAYFVSSYFAKPVERLKEQMNKLKEGNFAARVSIISEDEIGSLSEHFNSMAQQIQVLMQDIIDKQEAKRISDINFLQAQINPHFLYNTLASVRYVVSMHDFNAADKMLLALGRILRYALVQGNSLVSISYEVEWIKNYLIICNYGFTKPIEVQYCIMEEVKNCQILKMLLQPLVENAVLHGLKMSDRQPLLRISAYAIEDDLVIEVYDNGIGMDTNNLDVILDKEQDNSHVGIRNVEQRIKLYYGDTYGITVISKPGNGTTIQMRLPILDSKEEIRRYEDINC